MKKRAVWILAALLLLASGCGRQREEGGTEEPDVALNTLYAGMEESCGWEEGYMADVEGELLEGYYPGLSEIPAKQLVVKIPAMSSDVNEIVLMQGETEEDAESAAAILQARIDAQAEGGAWYPETQAAWEKAQVLREGAYVALIASGAHQEALEEQFRLQFQSKE
ncbi:DUF4358 domain-containing protein [uncultured Oscillibacter sp.]|uniref:DUF4358 domain-containing protein n=1 Tax=uncultured Oscillibacter sp. TaxID=876091 RepID=UPI002608426A|nr:DUF4358 domain-containing protein [uncultured Oscillibacter sp.]